MAKANEPKTLQQAIKYFADLDNCLDYLVARRWASGVTCPTCGSENVSFVPSRRVWQCKTRHAKCQFSVKVGTIFEDSPIPLDKWLAAMWMIANCKNGISSWEIHRALGITQKSAWFVLHRVRLALQSSSTLKLGGNGGEVEVDETFIGGKARNMHARRRQNRLASTGVGGKAPVLGILERGGQIRATVVPNRRKHALHGEIKRNVEEGSAIYTDALMSYQDLRPTFAHQVIDHAERYVDGRVHTNGLENFWSLLKRSIGGTYVSVEPFHLFRYLDEQVWRFNNRATEFRPMNDSDRFDLAVSQIVGKRLTFAEVTGKVGETRPQPEAF
jgi:transposase-like protein